MKRNRKKQYEDGILLESNLIIGKNINPLTASAIQLIFILLCLYGATFSLLSGLEIKVYNLAICFFMVLSTCVFFSIHFIKRFYFILYTVVSLLYLYAGYTLWDRIKNGFWHVENIYINHLNGYYNSGIIRYKVDEYDATYVLTIFFIFIVILLAFVVTQAIVGRLPIFIMLIPVLAFLILPLVVGKVPSTIPFAVYIISLFGVMGLSTDLNHGNKEKKDREFHIKKHSLKGKNQTLRSEKQVIRNKTFQYTIGLKSSLLLATIVGACFLTIPIIITPKFYEKHVRVGTIKKNIQTSMMEYNSGDIVDFFSQGVFANINLFPNTQSLGGLSGGKLGRVASVKFTNRTALKVTVTGDKEEIYLKGFAGSVYDGNSWTEFDKEILDSFKNMTDANDFITNPANLGSKLIDILDVNNDTGHALNEMFQMDYTIQNINIYNQSADTKTIYVPYLSQVPNKSDYNVNNEAYVKAKNKISNMEFTFYNVNYNLLMVDWEEAYNKTLNYWSSLPLGQDICNEVMEYRQYELLIKSFVYENYLQVPKMERLKEALGGMYHSYYRAHERDQESLLKAISYVREFVQKDTQYSLSPGALPSGKDFVEYFLFETHKGYCTHYASSGVIIFRMLGIPARYVEGYVIKESDFNHGKKIGSNTVEYRKKSEVGVIDKNTYELKIRDTNAHAWVEIYIDGFGWMPVELTPGFSQSENYLTEEEVTSDYIIQPTTQPTVTPVIESPEEEEDIRKGNVEETKNPPVEVEKTSTLVTLAVVFIIFVGLGFVPIIISYFVRKNRVKKASLRDTNGKALFYYVLLNRIFKYIHMKENEEGYQVKITETFETIGAEEFDQYIDIIKKAKFSKHLISEVELKYTQEFYHKIINDLYNNKPWYKQIFYKYIQIF
ncbi:MAG: transglutaminase-like domain-containing protein [Anaerocolumna sp.]